MTSKHPNADILRAIANGKKVQYSFSDTWYDLILDSEVISGDDTEKIFLLNGDLRINWRVKPKE